MCGPGGRSNRTVRRGRGLWCRGHHDPRAHLPSVARETASACQVSLHRLLPPERRAWRRYSHIRYDWSRPWVTGRSDGNVREQGNLPKADGLLDI